MQEKKENIERIIIITRKTRLEELLERYTTKNQVSFFLKTRNQSIDDYQLEYDYYYKSLEIVLKSLPKDIKIQIVNREFLSNYIFTNKDLILVLGQDGLVVNVAKYINNQPIFAINPDPERFDGILLPFLAEDVKIYINSAIFGNLPYRSITMGKIETNDKQVLYAFNDFFIGPRSHISAKYIIKYGEQSERQISSGIIVSTPAGTTGWLSSIFNMTERIFLNNQDKKELSVSKKLNWEERRMIFIVREPFISKWSSANIVIGEIDDSSCLLVESQMPEEGVIFSDGIEKDYISFNSGCIAKVQLAEKTTKLLVKPE
jgi:NAD kinase